SPNELSPPLAGSGAAQFWLLRFHTSSGEDDVSHRGQRSSHCADHASCQCSRFPLDESSWSTLGVEQLYNFDFNLHTSASDSGESVWQRKLKRKMAVASTPEPMYGSCARTRKPGRRW